MIFTETEPQQKTTTASAAQHLYEVSSHDSGNVEQPTVAVTDEPTKAVSVKFTTKFLESYPRNLHHWHRSSSDFVHTKRLRSEGFVASVLVTGHEREIKGRE